jgi:putative addiction module component (TIGR02574 family)
MEKISLHNILELSVPERILLVEDIWDSIASFPESVPLTGSQQQELDRRLEAYHQNPQEGSSWAQVKARIGSRK